MGGWGGLYTPFVKNFHPVQVCRLRQYMGPTSHREDDAEFPQAEMWVKAEMSLFCRVKAEISIQGRK